MITSRGEFKFYHQRLAETLERLAEFKTPQDIANHLVSAGIKGDAGCFSTCPLAVFLTKEVGQPVMVGAAYAGLSDTTFGSFGGLSIQLPDVVARFVTQVDDYEYTDLVKHVEEF